MSDRRSDCEFHDVPLQHLWRTMEQAATAPPSRNQSDDGKLIRSDWSVEHITTVLRGTMQCRSMTAAYRCLELLAALDLGIVSVDVTDISRDALEFAKEISTPVRDASGTQHSESTDPISDGTKNGVILVHIEDTMKLTAVEDANPSSAHNWEMPWWSYGRNGCVATVKLYLRSVSRHICELRIIHKDDLSFVSSKDTWCGDDVSGIQIVDSSQLWTSFRNLADILQVTHPGVSARFTSLTMCRCH